MHCHRAAADGYGEDVRRAQNEATKRIEDANAFYTGPWLDGIVQRYGMKPQIEFYEVFAVTDNSSGKVELFKEPSGLSKLQIGL